MNRVTIQNFLIGIIPPAAIGLILAVAGGHTAMVVCGTLTPLPPCQGFCMCAQIAWIPSWNALWLVPVGFGMGLLLAIGRIPYTRSSPLVFQDPNVDGS
jgi:hypothetical protein